MKLFTNRRNRKERRGLRVRGTHEATSFMEMTKHQGILPIPLWDTELILLAGGVKLRRDTAPAGAIWVLASARSLNFFLGGAQVCYYWENTSRE